MREIYRLSLMVKRQTLTLYLVVRIHQPVPSRVAFDGVVSEAKELGNSPRNSVSCKLRVYLLQ